MNPAPPVTTARGISAPRRGTRSPTRRIAAGSSRLRVSTMLRRCIGLGDSIEVEPPELVPLGEHCRARPHHRIAAYGSVDDLERREQRGRRLTGPRVVRAHHGSFVEQPRDDRDRRRVAQVVGVGLERETPGPDVRAGERAAARVADLVDHPGLLVVVDVDHAAEQAEVVARVVGRVEQCGGVLREARPTPARPRVQELEADARVVSHPEHDIANVGMHGFADVGDGVDERDLRGEEGVRRVLDHLCRHRVGHDDRSLDALVQIGDRAPRPPCPPRPRRPATDGGSRGRRCLRAGTPGSRRPRRRSRHPPRGARGRPAPSTRPARSTS